MISSIVWVPAGVADPNPKRYEMSSQEVEILRLLEEQEGQPTDDDDKGKKMRGGMRVKTTSSPVEHNLPADLRMDEYSDDEDEDAAIGKILMGQSSAAEMGDAVEQEDDDDEDAKGEKQEKYGQSKN